MVNVDIDVERLIYLVRERPVLWDKSIEDYKSRHLTVAAWMDVCCILYDGFELLGDRDKHVFEKHVVKKWTNVKDSWLKSYKKEMEESKAGTKSMKKYIYQKQLSFLRKNTLPRDTDFCFTSDDAQSTDNEVPAQPCSSSSIPDASTQQPTADVSNTKKRKYDYVERKVIDAVDSLNDRHLNFFRGLHPALRELSEDETLHFQMGVLSLLYDIRRARCAQDTHAAYHHHVTTTTSTSRERTKHRASVSAVCDQSP